jgi:hypothetical protein
MYTPVFSTDISRNIGRTLQFIMWAYRGSTERTLTNNTLYSVNNIQMYAQKYQTYATIWYTCWILHVRTIQPLDYSVIVPNVC